MRYSDAEDLWHEWVVLGYLHDATYLVITPDGDVYEEDYDPENDDITAVRLIPNGVLPLDLRRMRRHQFVRDPTADEMEAYCAALRGCGFRGWRRSLGGRRSRRRSRDRHFGATTPSPRGIAGGKT